MRCRALDAAGAGVESRSASVATDETLEMGRCLERYARAPVLRTLLAPTTAVPRAVDGRRWLAPLLIACAAVTFSGVAFALRLDASQGVLKKMEESGELAKASERELGEE